MEEAVRMTRTHFRALAKLVSDLPHTGESGFNKPQREYLARELALFCKQYNPRFNHSKFFTACGLK